MVGDFNQVRFKGTFRSYQQSVLVNAQRHLADGKVHIVAAPGSGKTVLGLELVRMLGRPTLVLSPSLVIAEQWGARFKELFLPEGADVGAYVSDTLRAPSLITSVTYQALHAASRRLKLQQSEQDDDLAEDEAENAGDAQEGLAAPDALPVMDYSDFDLQRFVRESGVGTVCLDEAHHLKQEWQRALEAFMADLPQGVVVIALTATPPYDSTPAEWDRYIAVCGEIDEEIFVPELVAQNTLCPHQDYLIFNFPTAKELEAIASHRRAVADFLEEAASSGLLSRLLESAGLKDAQAAAPNLYEHADSYLALYALWEKNGIAVPAPVRKILAQGGPLPKADAANAERALNFAAEHPELFVGALDPAAELFELARKHHLLHRNKLRLASDAKLDKALVTSLGKINSIARVAAAEYQQLGDGLRMLVLTDFIRKECLPHIGTNRPVETLGTTPIFEAVRRALPDTARVALLSGTLVIMPESSLEGLQQAAEGHGLAYSTRPIAGTDYVMVDFKGSNRAKVAAVTEVFQRGLVQVVVGTKALLGEGWDSPCINSLVMASFVGSYVLSNQMRGRAIRILANDPAKTANIWHLVALEPAVLPDEKLSARLEHRLNETHDGIPGIDFATATRRFECFFGPSYSCDEITNGISRIDIIRPPFDEAGIERINTAMLARAADRAGMAEQWRRCLAHSAVPEMLDMSAVPRESAPRPVVFNNLLVLGVLLALLSGSMTVFQSVLLDRLYAEGIDLAGLAALVVMLLLGLAAFRQAIRLALRVSRRLSPTRSIRAFARTVLATLTELGEIQTPGCVVQVTESSNASRIECALRGATAREKQLFGKAMSELLSPIVDARYLLLRRRPLTRRIDYLRSLSCPSFVATKKVAEVFERHLHKHEQSYHAFYTRSAEGRRVLLTCRRRSYLNRNNRYVKRLTRAQG
jgi:superfamily II DNA or RNA helicase